MGILKDMVAKTLKGVAIANSETTSIFFTFEPKMPKQLIEKDVCETRVDKK